MGELDNRTTPTSGMNTWRAGCGESRTSGSEGGPQKPTNRKAGRALRSDPYTYIPTGQGWLFLASVLDLGSRRLIGYAMAEHMRTELVLDALNMAVTARGANTNVAGVVTHADRGTQYTSNNYIDYCLARQMRPSVGRTGVCYDNAVAESFWESLKRECIQGRVFATRAEARRAIFRWINWYNTTRLHSTLNYTPPAEWEQQYRQAS